MTSILCHQCKRPNAVSARNCIWCRAQIAEGAFALERDATTIEADYLEGIARLDDPTPVRLIITRDGIEVVEMVPGSRSIKIPAGSIDEISVVDSDFEQRNTNSPWWRSALEPLGVSSARSNRANDERDYMLEVKYRDGDEVCKGLFRYLHRDGRAIARKLEHLLGKPVANDKHAEDHRTRG